MSPAVTAITAEFRVAHLSLKDESKVMRMLNAKGNGDRRQQMENGQRHTLTPRVLRRSQSDSTSQA